MRLLKLSVAGAAVLALAAVSFADTITLKNGRVINGTFLGGTARQVRVEIGDRVETLEIGDIQTIEFGGYVPAPPPPPPPPAESRMPRREEPVFRPDPTPPPPAPAEQAMGEVELPTGTNLVVRLIDGVDSQTNRVGQTFAASLDDPVMLNGRTVIPRGVDVVLKLVDAKESGKLVGRAELTLDLQSIKINGRMVDVNTQTVSRVSDSRGARTAKVAGGTAALGAIIGGIAGGGSGAAIGAAAGGAAGAGAEIVTKGQRVKIPSEARMTFVLDNPLRF